MPTEYFLPDEDDARVLRVLIEREKKRIQGKGVPYEQDHVPTAPEVYVALIPEGGIDGIEIQPGTSTGTGSGTGSDLSLGHGDRVSSVMCAIYELYNLAVEDAAVPGATTGAKQLVYLEFSEEVHNLSINSAPAGYTIIQRDKFGRFVTGAQSSSNRKKAVITQLGGILPEESGEVQIWSGRPTVATDVFENAWLDWLYVDDGLPQGQRIYIEKFEGDEEYTITEPWC